MAAFGEAGRRFAVGVDACDLVSMCASVAIRRPFAIVVTEEVYAQDRDVFDRLARDASAPLLRIDAHDVRGDVARLLAEALFESAVATDGSGVRSAIF